jgi:hypothetical protein
LDTNRTPSDRQPDEDLTGVRARTDDLSVAKNELIAELRSRVGFLERQLDVRRKEIRRRDAALEREQQLTAMFAERLSALEAPDKKPGDGSGDPAPGGGTRRDDLPAVGPEVYRTSAVSAILLAAGAGVAAGLASPLVVPRLGGDLWAGLYLLWLIPPVFGYWLGRTVAKLTESLGAEAVRLRELMSRFS